MTFLGPTLLLYLLAGAGVSIAVYLADSRRRRWDQWFQVVTALFFWPIYLPGLLASGNRGETSSLTDDGRLPPDDMAAAIGQVDTELDTALRSLDGWAEDVLAREKDRLHELRTAWSVQAQRIREMDGVLACENERVRESAIGIAQNASLSGEAGSSALSRWESSKQARRQNIQRLHAIRQRNYQDLMGTLAWVRELVSMIHLAKFTGAPASRAEELVAQIAAAVEGLSELTWQGEPSVSVASNISDPVERNMPPMISQTGTSPPMGKASSLLR